MILKGEIILWSAEKGSWHFFKTSIEDADTIRHITGHLPRKGFGSIKVQATIGATTVHTSIFPDKDGSYWLPLKASLRKAEGLLAGDRTTVELAFPDLV